VIGNSNVILQSYEESLSLSICSIILSVSEESFFLSNRKNQKMRSFGFKASGWQKDKLTKS
jgi:hypothetical protein